MKPFPLFRYHPDPISTGAIIKTDAVCECCGESSGYTYGRSLYSEDEPEVVCPWCIADGSAAEKFNGPFSDDHPLVAAGISQDIIDEVTKRTPGYVSWQGEYWMTCCNDACAFHGDESREYLMALDEEARRLFAAQTRIKDPVLLSDIIENYEPGGSPVFYRFECLHCQAVKHHVDFD